MIKENINFGSTSGKLSASHSVIYYLVSKRLILDPAGDRSVQSW